MTASRPPISCQVHRAVLIVIASMIVLLTGYLVFRGLPDLQQWVISAIAAVRDTWTSWHWTLL